MTSVRLRLLILALLPLVVLMPLLLFVAIGRWSANYDDVLIANVESDLRIAEQYMQRILVTTGGDVESLARSVAFRDAAALPNDAFSAYLDRSRERLQLDFLLYLPLGQAREMAQEWPVIAAAVAGTGASEIDIFSHEDLVALSPELAQQARLPLIDTEAAVPTDRTVEDRGMVVHTATDVRVPGRLGVLVGGVLLNRNLDFIDTINALGLSFRRCRG